MAKIVRKAQKQFGSSATAGEIAEFGSFAAGSYVSSTDPDVIQSLSNFLDGWFAAVVDENAPLMEDMNALFFLAFRQLAYIFQAGISEWDSATQYTLGSLATDANGVIYRSLQNVNTNNALSDAAWWSDLSGAIRTVTTTYAVLSLDGFIIADTTSAGFTVTLPSAATNKGKSIKIKKLGPEENVLTLASASGTIDGETTQELLAPYSGIEVKSDGTNWFVF